MSDSINVRKTVKIVLALIVFFFLWFVPAAILGLPDLTVIQQRVIAVFGLALVLWFTEAIPSWTTSMMIVVILLVTCSDSSLFFLRNGENMGNLLSHKAIMGAFADPTIMLFLGGFVIAIIASKMGIDVQLARILIKPFGKKSEFVLLAFLMITGVFSMFISNTATAAMMLTFMAPIIRYLPVDGKGRVGFVMSIPIGANLGGIATPVGTPPNAIALKYLNDPDGLNLNIGFGDWAMVMIPFTIVLLLLAWVLLIKIFPFKQKTIDLHIEGETEKGPRLVLAYVTLILTIILWLTDKFTGINANAVALIPIAVFCVTGLFTKDDLKEINWDVIWLVAGGFALGTALDHSGLAKYLVQAIPFNQWSPVIVIAGAGLLCYFFSNIISNTATSALLIPVMVAVGTGMGDVLAPYGGILTLILGVTLSASLAMILPVSTPPNAIAYSTGMVDTREMRKVGVIVGVVGLILAFAMLIIVGKAGIMLS